MPPDDYFRKSAPATPAFTPQASASKPSPPERSYTGYVVGIVAVIALAVVYFAFFTSSGPVINMGSDGVVSEITIEQALPRVPGYEYVQMPPEIKTQMTQLLESDPEAAAAVRDLDVRGVTQRGAPAGGVVAMILTAAEVEEVANREDVLDGVAETLGNELQEVQVGDFTAYSAAVEGGGGVAVYFYENAFVVVGMADDEAARTLADALLRASSSV